MVAVKIHKQIVQLCKRRQGLYGFMLDGLDCFAQGLLDASHLAEIRLYYR
jgi:hypothetical protein